MSLHLSICYFHIESFINYIHRLTSVHGRTIRSVPVVGSVPNRENENSIFSYSHSGAETKPVFSSATHLAIFSQEFGGDWRTKCVKSRFPDSLCLPCYVRWQDKHSEPNNKTLRTASTARMLPDY